ncbi:MAG: hypothetical protein M3Q97_10755, partial [Bacteroidota bacterium]|nr:hypothetical protein [Bacteroidota bacterium]
MRNIVSLFLLLLPFLLSAQKEYNVWYFGKGGGLDFNLTPPGVLTDGQLRSHEACASIADKDGKLLFYTDGETVWNQRHEMMVNGSAIGGSHDAAQGCIILPMPGSETIYYIITNNKTSLSYSTIDITMNGRLGSVTAKNIHLRRSTNESLAAVRHCNGKDIWILTHGYNNTYFFTFLLTDTGITAGPSTSVGGITGSGFGMIKIAPKGDKLATFISTPFFQSLSIFKFDNATGIVGPVIVDLISDFGDFFFNYGFEFSGDGNVFYANSVNAELYQFDLTAGDSTAIQRSRIDISGVVSYAYGLTRGPDGKIYQTGGRWDKLSVINDPNAKGTACQYTPLSIDLGGEYASIGLPNYLVEPGVSVRSVSFSLNSVCLNSRIILNPGGTSGIDSVHWAVYDLRMELIYSSTNTVDSLYMAAAGEYTVRLIAYKRCGSDTSTESFTVFPDFDEKGFDKTICPGDQVKLSATQNGSEYLWSNGSKDSFITITQSGIYTVEVRRGNCTVTYSYNIQQSPDLWTILGTEYFICPDENELVKLDAGKGFDTYLWYPTGDSSQWIMIGETGKYYVVVEDFRGCPGSDSTIVNRKCPGYIYFPNTFSPNGDGINDT